MAGEPTTVYLVYYDERHGGREIYGITSRKSWAESWAKRNQSLMHCPSMEEVNFQELVLDNPEIFPEAKEKKGGDR